MDSLPEDLQALTDVLNSGANLPAADPAELKAVWEILKQVRPERPGEQVAIGMDLITELSPSHRVLNMAEGMALMSRATLLTALFHRGVLTPFDSDGELNDVVFRAVAVMPVNDEDLGEATVQMHFSKELEAPPRFEQKFLAAVRAAQENT